MEWDTAAADAIVRESGKQVYTYESNSLLEYNKEKLINPWFVVSKKY
jgi:3'(2'), 5'-bisphosphate nucleotidase